MNSVDLNQHIPLTVVVTGPDGSGKSSLCSALVERVPGITHINVWNGFKKLGFTDPRALIEELSPSERLEGVVQSFALQLKEALTSEIVLIDSYYYKYFVSELCYDLYETRAKEIVASLPAPQKVFYCEVSPEEAWDRKDKASSYESGLVRKPNRDSFLNFQKRMVKVWKRFDNHGWEILSGNLESNIQTVEKYLFDQDQLAHFSKVKQVLVRADFSLTGT